MYNRKFIIFISIFIVCLFLTSCYKDKNPQEETGASLTTNSTVAQTKKQTTVTQPPVTETTTLGLTDTELYSPFKLIEITEIYFMQPETPKQLASKFSSVLADDRVKEAFQSCSWVKHETSSTWIRKIPSMPDYAFYLIDKNDQIYSINFLGEQSDPAYGYVAIAKIPNTEPYDRASTYGELQKNLKGLQVEYTRYTIPQSTYKEILEILNVS